MKVFKTIALAAAIGGVSTVAMACPFCKPKTKGLFLGPATLMGNGTVHGFINIGKDGKPTSIGATFSELALENLPEKGEGGMGPEFLVTLPEAAGKTPFNHIGIDWNAKGHEPKGIYDVPHFDFHFYMVTPPERGKMKLENGGIEKFRKLPPAPVIPRGYIFAPGTEVPYMGAHWVDPTSPELSGKPFTSTFIYGSYDGKSVFIEPMITLAFIQSKPEFRAPIKQSDLVDKAGFYPTEYSLTYNPQRREYTVAMENFVWREPLAKSEMSQLIAKEPK